MQSADPTNSASVNAGKIKIYDPQKPSGSQNIGVVHVNNRNGHRAHYQDLFADMFNLAPSEGRIGLQRWFRLVCAGRIMFATIDDDYLGFLAVALFRALLGRRTAGLFLRPEQCFLRTRPIYRLKYLVFRFLRHLPRLSLFCIVPFRYKPSYQSVASDWVHDPQLWDIVEVRNSPIRHTRLTKEITGAACRRAIIAYVGTVSRRKGADFLADILEADPELTQLFLIVVAGTVSHGARAAAERIAAAGGLVIDRHISNTELESIYHVSDFVWCCYAPYYDQASGIFGRCIQFGCQPVIRHGAMLEGYVKDMDLGAVALSFDDPYQAARAMHCAAEETSGPNVVTRETILSWRNDFWRKLQRAL